MHTPEPWKINHDDSTEEWSIVTNQNGSIVANVNEETGPELAGSIPVMRKMPGMENARRIVECVNACAGFTTEDLLAHTGPRLLHTRLKNAFCRIDGLLGERNSTGLAIDAAIRDGVVPEQHPLRSRLEMLANHRKREQELLDLLREASATLQACGALCDAVPTRLQNHEDDTLAGIGRIVNEQGLYHLVRDTEAKLRGAIDAEIAGTKAE